MHQLFTDQMGREVSVNFPPRRIVSLVPSQTELLFDLGLNEEVVGLTKFCIHPIDKFAARTKVGGTKTLHIDRIRDLKPDLIIGNKEENQQDQIELLEREFPVWMSDIYTLGDAISMIRDIGAMVNRSPEASYLTHLIRAGFDDLQRLAEQRGPTKRVAYLIWKDPYMAAARDTFIDHLLGLNGFANVFRDLRYPEVTLEKLSDLQPDLVFLSSEPYPFKEKHVLEIGRALPDAKVMLVDGEMFSWYGSRLVKAVEYLFHLQQELASV
ncbi:ABC transporter substrate-binding protein [Pedobacter deserti]|uniref:ABC transporter substrate-binding protein n=1 Tax=Pedobacter deserti TaxID=2817382 RepID=UPI00210A74B0|nr:helical backbone metal receptor [Pedobacter sp. SYSU D00382]